MWIEESFKCDVCGKEITPRDKPLVVGLVDTGARWILEIYDFDVISARKTPIVCGEACLHVHISQNLGKLRGYSI